MLTYQRVSGSECVNSLSVKFSESPFGFFLLKQLPENINIFLEVYFSLKDDLEYFFQFLMLHLLAHLYFNNVTIFVLYLIFQNAAVTKET